MPELCLDLRITLTNRLWLQARIGATLEGVALHPRCIGFGGRRGRGGEGVGSRSEALHPKIGGRQPRAEGLCSAN